MSLDAALLADRLRGAFPPGVRRLFDLEDPEFLGPLLEACAEVLYEHGVKMEEALRRELNPTTCTAAGLLPEWESGLGLSATEIARFGTERQRQAQVLSRLRERGAPTYELVRSVVAPLLDYADPAQLEILETDRDALRNLHLYPWTSLETFPATVKIKVDRDDAFCGPMGIQFDAEVTTPELGLLTLFVTSPAGVRSVSKAKLGNGPAAATTCRFYFPEFEGVPVAGEWTLAFNSISGGEVSAVFLFAEGVGRDSAGNDGLGAAMFEWGVVAEPAKMGPNANLRAAEAAIRRINYATRRGRLVRRSSGAGALPAGNFAAIPDDPGTLPDACIPGT
jgi:hypothetical protein